jgi:predicted metalloendopeptidase
VHDFALKAVRGIHTKPPRWKRCLLLVDRDVGDDVGREFLTRHPLVRPPSDGAIGGVIGPEPERDS